MRDPHYRSLCDFPDQYDTTIDWVIANNPYAPRVSEGPEEWASCLVNSLISAVCFGEQRWTSCGRVIAVRVFAGREGPSKAMLAVQPLPHK